MASLGVLLATLLTLSACTQQAEPLNIHQVGDPLAGNRITVNASFLPNEPFLQSWAVMHQVPFILPLAPSDVRRIDFQLGSRSPWLVRFHNWSGAHTAKPPATLTVTAARWNLIARTGRDHTLEATAALEPGLELVLAGVCHERGCPYEFAQPDRADDWLSFSLSNDDVPELATNWLRPRDEVTITVSLAVWLRQDGSPEPGAVGADYLSVNFHLTSQDSSLLVASR